MQCHSKSDRFKLRSQRGFTLVEVLVAVFILAAVFVGFYVNLKQGFAAVEASRENLRATQILEQQMETIRLYTWSQINSNGFVPTSFTSAFTPDTNGLSTSHYSTNALVYTGAVTISTNVSMTESYASNFVLVTVALTWRSDVVNVTNSRQMSTLVSQYGLHNYYY
jgi:prepilin-type N-terminal cleavage/methylation domain-containing protein